MGYVGIDYGMGQTNIDQDTGIRYGVIHANSIGTAWYEQSEPQYGEPCCPDCGNELRTYSIETDENIPLEGRGTSPDYTCENCNQFVSSDYAFSDEAVGYVVTGDTIATQSGSDCDIFVIKSPYFTYAQFCSPCAPGAVHLGNPMPEGAKGYCFGHDWFEEGKAPYPVYSVETGELVLPEA